MPTGTHEACTSECRPTAAAVPSSPLEGDSRCCSSMRSRRSARARARSRRGHREQQMQLGVLGHERLDESRALGIEPARASRRASRRCCRDVRGVQVVGERVPVGDEVVAVQRGPCSFTQLARRQGSSPGAPCRSAASRQHAFLRGSPSVTFSLSGRFPHPLPAFTDRMKLVCIESGQKEAGASVEASELEQYIDRNRPAGRGRGRAPARAGRSSPARRRRASSSGRRARGSRDVA